MGLHLGLGLTGQRVGFNPATLFTVAGSRGFTFDLSDYGTQWQDTGATVPITSTSQSVARMDDKSGLGNHATQGTAGNRPLTTTIGAGFRGIQFDGVDDWLQTAAIDFSNSDEVTVVAGVRKLSDAAAGLVVELTTGLPSRFALRAPGSAGPNYQFDAGGSAIVFLGVVGSFPAPETAILTGQSKISTDTLLLRRNGVQNNQAVADQGTGNYANAQVFIGRRGGTSLPFNGVLTFLFAINRLLTANELASVEAYANARTGAF